MTRRYKWFILVVLLVAALLRLAAIDDIPPGLTHDEADHGLDAWGVVNGIRPIYFTVGFGREPLYDYSTAVLMSFLGPSYLAGRLTSVFISLIFIAATYAWVRQAFNSRTALLTSAGLAVGFWPLMTSRQALRSITLVAVLSLAAFFFWRGMGKVRQRIETDAGQKRFCKSLNYIRQMPIIYFLTAGFFLGLSFYTYIPARVLWAVFPALLLLLLFVGRGLLFRIWWQVGLMLVVAAVIGLPLFQFLSNNPEAESRLDQLSEPFGFGQGGGFSTIIRKHPGWIADH